MSAINKFSLGNHRLRIETGRYTVPKTLEHVRICSLWQANELESECHVIFFFFLHSVWYASQQIFLMKSPKLFNDFDVKSKLLFLFNNIDPFICKSVATRYFWDYEL